MSEEFLRQLLAERLVDEPDGEGPTFQTRHRERLLDAATHAIAALRLTAEVLEDVVESLRADDDEDETAGVADPQDERPLESIPLTYDVADATPDQYRHEQGDLRR